MLSAPWTSHDTRPLRDALDVASHVIICVSPGFKRSAICRMQARYANQYYKKDRLKLVFVMMNKYYTPEMKVDGCDGWLGFMIGDAPWQPLWHDQHIAPAVAALAAGHLGEQSKSGQTIEGMIDAQQFGYVVDSKQQQQRAITSGESGEAPSGPTHMENGRAGSFSGLEDHPEV